jgi:hypothetical protein
MHITPWEMVLKISKLADSGSVISKMVKVDIMRIVKREGRKQARKGELLRLPRQNIHLEKYSTQ